MRLPRAGNHATTQESRTMSPRRLRLVNAFLLTLIAGSVYCIAIGNEIWPFSNYPMYSGVREERALSVLRLFGVAADGSERRIFIATQMPPFDRVRLSTALQRIMSRDRNALHKALRDCWEQYELARLSGEHQGPALVRVRLYRLNWEIDELARDADHPDSRALLAEIDVTGGD
jgi:hypothetical protein